MGNCFKKDDELPEDELEDGRKVNEGQEDENDRGEGQEAGRSGKDQSSREYLTPEFVPSNQKLDGSAGKQPNTVWIPNPFKTASAASLRSHDADAGSVVIKTTSNTSTGKQPSKATLREPTPTPSKTSNRSQTSQQKGRSVEPTGSNRSLAQTSGRFAVAVDHKSANRFKNMDGSTLLGNSTDAACDSSNVKSNDCCKPTATIDCCSAIQRGAWVTVPSTSTNLRCQDSCKPTAAIDCCGATQGSAWVTVPSTSPHLRFQDSCKPTVAIDCCGAIQRGAWTTVPSTSTNLRCQDSCKPTAAIDCCGAIQGSAWTTVPSTSTNLRCQDSCEPTGNCECMSAQNGTCNTTQSTATYLRCYKCVKGHGYGHNPETLKRGAAGRFKAAPKNEGNAGGSTRTIGRFARAPATHSSRGNQDSHDKTKGKRGRHAKKGDAGGHTENVMPREGQHELNCDVTHEMRSRSAYILDCPNNTDTSTRI